MAAGHTKAEHPFGGHDVRGHPRRIPSHGASTTNTWPKTASAAIDRIPMPATMLARRIERVPFRVRKNGRRPAIHLGALGAVDGYES